MSRSNHLFLPTTEPLNASTPPTIAPATASLETPDSVVIVGANGSGKTRLGSWFEFNGPQVKQVHRVAAQKSLRFPDSISPTSLVSSEREFRYGVSDSTYNTIGRGTVDLQPYKAGQRWKTRPNTEMLDDFSLLLTYLFTEDYEVSTKYRQDVIKNEQHTIPAPSTPLTKLDRIKRIWEQVLPHRHLTVGAGAISAQSVGTALYKASEMSDGERVAFYLIGQCLAAAPDSIIVVDEPEVHLHRVVQTKLWDAIEAERVDCLFVYLTHDLDFAASRTEAKKIWLKNYDGQSWDWKEVPHESEGLPEEILLAILGSREPILFTEGDRGGLEQAIFPKLYPDWTIVPRGGCDEVIKSTQAFRALKHLHGIDCQGIVDLDYRSPREITTLLAQGIHVLSVQEIENLLLVESVVTVVATHAHESGLTANLPADTVRNVKKAAFDNLTHDKEALVSKKTAWELEQQLHKIDRQGIGVAALEKARDAAAQFDVAAKYAAFEQEANNILANQDYAGLLRIYNNKGLAKQAGKFFGTLSYLDFVKRLLSTDKGEAIVRALQAAAPTLV